MLTWDLMAAVRSTARLHAEGMSRPSIAAAVQSGELIKLQRNAYISGSIWSSLDPWDRPVVTHAAVLISRPRVLFSHLSAAMIYDAPLLKRPETVHLIETGDRMARRAGVMVHRKRADCQRDRREIRGFSVTSPLVTAANCAKTLPRDASVPILDHFLREGLCTREEMRAALEACTGRGCRLARTLPLLTSDLAESIGETLTRLAMHDWGLATPEEQVPLMTPSGSTAFHRSQMVVAPMFTS